MCIRDSLKSHHKELTAKDQALYSLLFGDNISYQSTDNLLKAWKKAGLKFPEKVKLLSVFQNSPGDVSNFHTAIAYEKDGSIYVFEKQDPTLPYRWSRFNNWADIKTHLSLIHIFLNKILRLALSAALSH